MATRHITFDLPDWILEAVAETQRDREALRTVRRLVNRTTPQLPRISRTTTKEVRAS